jgi:hypothetical protein
MKAKNNFLSAPFALKLVGFILIFSSLVDYLFLLTGLDSRTSKPLAPELLNWSIMVQFR